MVDLLRILDALPGVHGARCSGAGFRGCCVAREDAHAADGIVAAALDRCAQEPPEPARGSFALASRPAGAAPL